MKRDGPFDVRRRQRRSPERTRNFREQDTATLTVEGHAFCFCCFWVCFHSTAQHSMADNETSLDAIGAGTLWSTQDAPSSAFFGGRLAAEPSAHPRRRYPGSPNPPDDLTASSFPDCHSQSPPPAFDQYRHADRHGWPSFSQTNELALHSTPMSMDNAARSNLRPPSPLTLRRTSLCSQRQTPLQILRYEAPSPPRNRRISKTCFNL